MKRIIFYIIWILLYLIFLFYFDTQSTLLFLEDFHIYWEVILVGSLLGPLCAILGLLLYLNRIAFFGLSLSQSASLGILLCYFIAYFFDSAVHLTELPLASGFLASLLFALAYGRIQKKKNISDEMLLATFYSIALSLTLILGQLVPEGHNNIEDLLFGNAVALTRSSFYIGLTGSIILISLLSFKFKKLYSFAIDADFVQTQGHSKSGLKVWLYVLLSLGITLAVHILGALAVFSLLYILPLIALRNSNNRKSTWLICLFLGLVTFPLGYLSSHNFDLPTGASTGLVACYLFLGSFIEKCLGNICFTNDKIKIP